VNISQPKLRSEKFDDDDDDNDDDDDDDSNNNNFYNVKESGIYQLICPNCNKSYTGHHIFLKYFKDHFQLFKHGNDKSTFSQYIIKKWTLDGPH